MKHDTLSDAAGKLQRKGILRLAIKWLLSGRKISNDHILRDNSFGEAGTLLLGLEVA